MIISYYIKVASEKRVENFFKKVLAFKKLTQYNK